MHLVDEQAAVPVEGLADLISYFSSAAKPRDQWRVGSEHELIAVIQPGGEAPPYEGPHGIGTLLDAFAARGGTPVHDHGRTIAVTRTDTQLTIEPGGQFELASRPVADDHAFASDLAAYVEELGDISCPMRLAWIAGGIRPFGRREDIPWMPKQRYDVMRAYMPTVGTRGLDMMLRTATVQTNLDFGDEADTAAKMRCVMSVTSILTALWAASPVVEDRPSGMQSYRAWIWRDTDNARAGLLPFVFEREDIFTAYAEWALDVPMYFVYRQGYQPVPADLTFRRFMAEGWNGHRATQEDWALHLSTLFPEARLKRYIEVRGCDCSSMPMIAALGPLMRGLLYDVDARAAATALTAGLSMAERERLADDVPRSGLATRVGDHTLGDLARELVAIARDGLSRVAPTSVPLIAPVEEVATTGRTHADVILERWEQHASDRAKLVKALSHPELC